MPSSNRPRALALVFSLPLAAAAMGMAALGTGCEPKTSLTQVWSAPVPISARPMHKLVVMASKMDEANRRVLEDTFVAGLRARGVDAIPAYKLFPEGVPDRAKAEQAVESIGADGVLVATFRGSHEVQTYTPGIVTPGYYAWGYASYADYYPGYVSTDVFVRLETTLWDARAANTVVWSGLTNTANPSTGRDFVDSVSATVLPALANAGFIPPRPNQ
jgi:hypothetical protein